MWKYFFIAAVNHDICWQDTSFRGKCKQNCASNAFQDQILFTTGRERGGTLTRAGSTEVASARVRAPQLNEGRRQTSLASEGEEKARKVGEDKESVMRSRRDDISAISYAPPRRSLLPRTTVPNRWPDTNTIVLGPTCLKPCPDSNSSLNLWSWSTWQSFWG